MIEGEEIEYEEWQIDAQQALEALGARQFEMRFSGGNDQGGIDHAWITYPDGTQREIDEDPWVMYHWTMISGISRDVRYSVLKHPEQALINQLLEASWEPIGASHGGFATSDDSHVAGSVQINLDYEDPDRFIVDPGEWVTTYWCYRGHHELESEYEECTECASMHFCPKCDESEVDEEGKLCMWCEQDEESTPGSDAVS